QVRTIAREGEYEIRRQGFVPLIYVGADHDFGAADLHDPAAPPSCDAAVLHPVRDRKSTRLNSSHGSISYAVFCLKKKKNTIYTGRNGITRQTTTPPWFPTQTETYTSASLRSTQSAAVSSPAKRYTCTTSRHTSQT